MGNSAAAPKGIGPSGRALWNSIAKIYDLRPDEKRILTDACREADLIAQMDTDYKKSTLMVKGSMGQPVVNPLVAELRQHRGVLARLLAQLKLPDQDPAESNGEATPTRSTNARAAANARWATRGA